MPDARKKPKPKKGKAKETPPRPVTTAEVEGESANSNMSSHPRDEPPLARELRAELWSEENPFALADPSLVDLGGPQPSLTPDLIDAILTEMAPAFWLELGARLGGATILTAERIKLTGAGTAICAVDSFSGDVTAWLAEKGARERGEWRYLHLAGGTPTIYARFLANVQQAGHTDVIVPLPSTPLVAMRLIRALVEAKRLSRVPDVISLHAGPDPDDILPELQRAWKLLEPSGVLFGDDWSLPGVRNDVRAFARTVEADTTRMVAFLRRFEESYLDGNVFLYKGQWVLFKPASGDG